MLALQAVEAWSAAVILQLIVQLGSFGIIAYGILVLGPRLVKDFAAEHRAEVEVLSENNKNQRAESIADVRAERAANSEAVRETRERYVALLKDERDLCEKNFDRIHEQTVRILQLVETALRTRAP